MAELDPIAQWQAEIDALGPETQDAMVYMLKALGIVDLAPEDVCPACGLWREVCECEPAAAPPED